MAADREVLREIWEGKLPICFQLNAEEVDDIQAPEPLYLMVPRLSYFPLVVDKVRKHFMKFVSPDHQDNEMWLEHHGTALKWLTHILAKIQFNMLSKNALDAHDKVDLTIITDFAKNEGHFRHYPIGVLFDMYKDEIQLPWNVTVHFDKFPESELLHCKSRDVVESHFMACLKEADALKHKTQMVTNMQRKDHNQLWLGLQNDKFDQFWAVNRRLMEPGPEEGFKYIPFRFYNKDESLVQKLVKPFKDNGERKTLSDMLLEMFPDSDEAAEIRVITHGVEPPRDTPLQWLSEHLSYPDNFLHLVAAKS